jgi:hypothetical protein
MSMYYHDLDYYDYEDMWEDYDEFMVGGELDQATQESHHFDGWMEEWEEREQLTKAVEQQEEKEKQFLLEVLDNYYDSFYMNPDQSRHYKDLGHESRAPAFLEEPRS